MIRRAARAEGGQAVVEFALVLPLVLVILIGMLELGYFLNAKQQLADVARQAARTYALTGDPELTVDAASLAGRQLPGFRDSATLTIAFDKSSSTARGKALDAAGRLHGITLPPGLAKKPDTEWVSATVTYDFPNPVRIGFGDFRFPATITISTSATARIEVDEKDPSAAKPK
jgi:hypothetical protein